MTIGLQPKTALILESRKASAQKLGNEASIEIKVAKQPKLGLVI